MEYPMFAEQSSLSNTINYNATFPNFYSSIVYNNSDSSNNAQFDEESHFKLKVLWYNYLQQLYLRQQEKRLYEVPWALVVLLSLLYSAISVTALVGNGLVIWIVLGSKKMRTVTNLYICNLAVADLIIGLLVVPFHFQAALLQEWLLPHFLCALCPFFQVLGVSLNALTLCVIAVDRYRAVMHPLRVKTTKSKALLFLALIWTLSLVLALPTYLDYKVVIRSTSILSRPREFCHSVIYSTKARMLYHMGLFAVQYAIPVVIITFAYVRMGLHLWGRILPGNQDKGRDAVLLKNKKQSVKTFTLVVMLFGICWLPFQVYNFLQYVVPVINHYQYINIIWFGIHWLAMSNSCVNPFVYTIYYESFQQQFRERTTCCRKHDCLIRNRTPEPVTGSDKNESLERIGLQVITKGNLQIPGPALQEVNTKLTVGLAEKPSFVTGVSNKQKEIETVVTKFEIKSGVHFKTELVTVLKGYDANML